LAPRPLAARLVAITVAVIASLTLLVIAAGDTYAGDVEIQGDADCSSAVTAGDALDVFRDASGMNGAIGCETLADVDCDEDIDVDDGLAILRYLAGLGAHFGTGCPFVGAAIGSPTFVIDATVVPPPDELPGIDGGPTRPMGAAQDSSGIVDEYVANQVVFWPDDDAELQAFLAKYDGVILTDGVTEVPDGTPGGPYASIDHGYYVIQVDPALSTLDDLIANMTAAGMTGPMVFSSETAARMVALRLREEHVALDIITPMQTVLEHPNDTGGNIDFETKPHMTEDDDPSTPGNQGHSVGVVHAWEYLLYKGLPPTQGLFDPVGVAIVDSGFALDTTTGLPLNGNLDYQYNTRPAQLDVADDDTRAGGENLLNCTGGTDCPWHGTGVFGVCCSSPRNGFGAAGSGGKVTRPLLIKVDATWSSLAEGIREAALLRADVVTISIGGDCGANCVDIEADLQDAVDSAIGVGAVVLAAAGNDSIDISNLNYIPCKLPGVICVGSVQANGNNLYNFGTGVDIWAPTDILSTVTPDSVNFDLDNDHGEDELYLFGGTSASTPFVAGIVALMKALDPNISGEEVLDILQDNSNAGGTNVTEGIVDAFKAVIWASFNGAPTIDIVRPIDTQVSYTGTNLRVVVTDPEPGKDLPLFEGLMHVVFEDQGHGVLCDTNFIVYGPNAQIGFECDTGPLDTASPHTIVAKVFDAFGGTATDTIVLNPVNTAPIVEILAPPSGNTYYATQNIDFGVYVFDPDEDIFFPADRIVWTSNIDGQIGTGDTLHRTLPTPGLHTITVTATDTRDAVTTDSITLLIQSGAGVPVVDITSPPDNEPAVSPGTEITLTGQVTDPEQGTLPDASLRWYSDWDGFLGDGPSITTTLSNAPGNPCINGAASTSSRWRRPTSMATW